MTHIQTPRQDRWKGLALAFCMAVLLSGAMLAGTAVADETTDTAEVNATTLSDASTVNMTVEISGLNNDSTLVQSFDSSNNTAVVQTELGGTPVNSTLEWQTDDDEVTTDLTAAENYGNVSYSGDTTNITVDQSVDTITADGETVYGGTLVGGITGSGGNNPIYIGVIAVVGYILLKD